MQIYSSQEAKLQKKFKKLKVKFLKLPLFVLDRTKIKPNQITIFGLFISLALLLSGYFTAAVCTQLICDLLDGALAEKQNSHSLMGAKLDILSDYLFVTSAGLYWWVSSNTHWALIFTYLTLVHTQNYLQIYLNKHKKETGIILRPRISILLIQALNLSAIISTQIAVNLTWLAVATMTIQVPGLLAKRQKTR